MTGDASMFGVPQKRLRLYLVAVLTVANVQFDFLQRSVADTFRTLRGLLKVCPRQPPCVALVLYSGSDPRVLQHLEARRKNRASRVSTSYSMDKAITQATLNGVSWSSIQAPKVLKKLPLVPDAFTAAKAGSCVQHVH